MAQNVFHEHMKISGGFFAAFGACVFRQLIHYFANSVQEVGVFLEDGVGFGP